MGDDTISIYDYQKLVGKIQDIPTLRNAFIAVFDDKDKKQMAKFGLKYSEHILKITGLEATHELSCGYGDYPDQFPLSG